MSNQVRFARVHTSPEDRLRKGPVRTRWQSLLEIIAELAIDPEDIARVTIMHEDGALDSWEKIPKP